MTWKEKFSTEKKDAGWESTESEASKLHQKEAAANLQVADNSFVLGEKLIDCFIFRYFVFFALGYLVLWESYSHLSMFYTHGLADRAYGL